MKPKSIREPREPREPRERRDAGIARRSSFGSLLGEVGIRLLGAAAKDPQAVIDTTVALSNVYVEREHNARIGWLHSLTTHGNEGVRTASTALLKALDAAGVKPVLSVAIKLPPLPPVPPKETLR